jgi:NAD(P)-dependent dehydrogenase (short-subunit alcohol dehydrogenase family)
LPTDVTQEDSVRAAIDTAVRHYGGLHILHNNAGMSTRWIAVWRSPELSHQ